MRDVFVVAEFLDGGFLFFELFVLLDKGMKKFRLFFVKTKRTMERQEY